MSLPRLMDGSQPAIFNLVWIALLAPLVGFLFQAALGRAIENSLGRQTGRRVLGCAGVFTVVISFAIGAILFFALCLLPASSRAVISVWFDWVHLQSLHVPFELRIDPLSVTMLLIVSGVGGLIHIYATGYMATDRDYPRFFTYFNLFIFFMLALVLANNLAVLFIGWEGVGLCSYLLIGYWYADISNAKAANKAFIVNRVGDWGMALGLFLIVVLFASNQALLGEEKRYLSFDVILPLAHEVLGQYGDAIVAAVPILLFVGAVGKSAQFPLYLWLPDAMAGPTPVSALIHAATMVTAGVYLVARCHVFFELSPLAMLIVAVVGAFTAVFAASIAFGQTDIKRVLAYSTVSQLGFMFLACGVGAFYAGMFHVTTHAFFKALLFLGAGAVIHAMAHNQDLRNYGNLWKFLPITFFTMLMAWLAICGIPPWAGFFSKDDILGKTFASSEYWIEQGWLIDPRVLYGVGLVTAVMTAAYMTRMFWLTFLGGQERWRSLPQPEHGVHHRQEHGLHEEHEADEHGFFMTAEEEAQHSSEEDEHHHELAPDHTPKEVGPAMWLPLAVLGALSLIGGAVLSGLYPLSEVLGMHVPNFFKEWNAPSTAPALLPAKEMFHASVSTEWILIIASVAAGVLGIAVMAFRYRKGLPKSEERIRGLQAWAGAQWFYDSAMYQLFVNLGGRFAEGVSRWFDKGVIDGIIVNGSAWTVATIGKLFRKTQTGYVRSYAMAMLLGGIAILTYIYYMTTK